MFTYLQKIDGTFKSNPESYSSLKEILKEGSEVLKESGKTTSAAEALLWLKR